MKVQLNLDPTKLIVYPCEKPSYILAVNFVICTIFLGDHLLAFGLQAPKTRIHILFLDILSRLWGRALRKLSEMLKMYSLRFSRV